jgi:hypothetical protein
MTKTDLEKYKELGWKFNFEDYWYGETYDCINFKSPRMLVFAELCSSRHLTYDEMLGKVTEDELIKQESLEVAKRKWEIMEYNIKKVIIQAIAEGKKTVEVSLE